MRISRNDTAVVIIDPQNDVLSEQGAWKAVGASVRENRTVENIERIFQAARAAASMSSHLSSLLLSDGQRVGCSMGRSKPVNRRPTYSHVVEP